MSEVKVQNKKRKIIGSLATPKHIEPMMAHYSVYGRRVIRSRVRIPEKILNFPWKESWLKPKHGGRVLSNVIGEYSVELFDLILNFRFHTKKYQRKNSKTTFFMTLWSRRTVFRPECPLRHITLGLLALWKISNYEKSSQIYFELKSYIHQIQYEVRWKLILFLTRYMILNYLTSKHKHWVLAVLTMKIFLKVLLFN